MYFSTTANTHAASPIVCERPIKIGPNPTLKLRLSEKSIVLDPTFIFAGMLLICGVQVGGKGESDGGVKVRESEGEGMKVRVKFEVGIKVMLQVVQMRLTLRLRMMCCS